MLSVTGNDKYLDFGFIPWSGHKVMPLTIVNKGTALVSIFSQIDLIVQAIKVCNSAASAGLTGTENRHCRPVQPNVVPVMMPRLSSMVLFAWNCALSYPSSVQPLNGL